jgi:hypothetical protein
LNVSIRSTRERLGFKAERRLTESLTHDRFILCSRVILEIRGPLILCWRGPGYRGHKKFSFYLKVCFHPLTKGKIYQANWRFPVNKAFWFENRRWANRGFPDFHVMFSQDMVECARLGTRIRFSHKGLWRFSRPAVNRTVLKRDAGVSRNLSVFCLTGTGSPPIEAPTEPGFERSGLYYIASTYYGSSLRVDRQEPTGGQYVSHSNNKVRRRFCRTCAMSA